MITQGTQTENRTQIRSYLTRVTKEPATFNAKTVKNVVIASAIGGIVASLAMLGIASAKNDSFPISNKTLLCISVGVITGAAVFVGGIAGCLSKKFDNEQNPPVTNV